MTRTTAPGHDGGQSVDDGFEHESVRVERGSRSGLTFVVAVHSTALGPAIGGCRLRWYPTWRDGMADALALSAAMTDKAALAGLAHGGGKTVVVLPSEPLDPARRVAVIQDVAGVIADLGGRYLTGPDIGTGPADMQVIHDRTGFAFCRPTSEGGSGDSASATARGVIVSMQAAVQHVFGSSSLRGRRVAMMGFGQVGAVLARMLVDRGAELAVTDIDPRRRDLAAEVGAQWVDADGLLSVERDILVPAAAGGLLTDAVASSLRCRLVVGPANNQLETDAVADRLHERDIVWVPDTVAGAGGILRAIAIEEQGCDEAQAASRVDAIGDTVAAVLSEADERGVTPLAVARGRVVQLRDQARTRLAFLPTELTGGDVTARASDSWAADSTRSSYDGLAGTYLERLGDELTRKPLDRALLQLFADDAGAGARTLDLGCGPGHVAAHLAGLGLRPVGVDLSPGMIEVARDRHPQLEFQCADILELPAQLHRGGDPGDQEGFAAAVAFYSLIHFDPPVMQRALRSIRTVLRPGAPFLIAFHRGDEVRHVDELWGTPVDLDFRFLRTGDVRNQLELAGFVVESVTERAPYPEVEAATERSYLFTRAAPTA